MFDGGQRQSLGRLTKARRPILLALHKGLDIKRVAKAFNMTEAQMVSEIKPLQEYNLVKVIERARARSRWGTLGDHREVKESSHENKISTYNSIDNRYQPDFFIADFSETEKIYLHAKETGKMLAEALLRDWKKLEQAFSGLSFGKSHSLKEQGFMFVGARILDLGVLGALVRDKSLLTIAPARPLPASGRSGP